MDVGAVKTKEKPIVEKPIHVSFGGQTVEYRCGNCDIAPKSPKQGWTPTFEVCTQRRLCCAPSVHFLRTILTH